jgi:hypothetical protein
MCCPNWPTEKSNLDKSEVNPAICIAGKKVTAIVATLRHVVRYSNSDDSGQASHSSNFSKKMLDEEKFRETSHLPLVVSHRSVRQPPKWVSCDRIRLANITNET